MVFRILVLQLMATLVAVLLCVIYAGVRGGVSAALGGLACALPNVLLAWRVKVASTRHRAGFVVVFFLGEIVKLVAIIGLLVYIAKAYDDLHWPSLLIGVGCATYALLFLAFWKKS